MAWWRAGGPGLVAVLGIAGCGKTALAAHFLEAVRPNPGSDAAFATPAPDMLFVFSFRVLADPKTCLDRLEALLPKVERRAPESDDSELAEDASPEPFPDNSLLGRLHASTGRLLILFDALDAVQVPVERADGITWEIEDAKLRELISELASGRAANVALLTTSRLPFEMGLHGAPNSYESGSAEAHGLRIDLDRFERDEAVRFLRRQGLMFSEALLIDAALACADHPCVLTAFGRTATKEPIGLPSFEDWLFKAVSHGRADCHETLRVLAGQYFSLLDSSAPAAIALLEKLKLFERPVSVAILRNSLATSPLAEGSRFDAAMRTAIDLHLLVFHEKEQNKMTLHPLLRFGRSSRDSDHDRRQEITEELVGLLVETPHGEPPSDRHRLDLIEEILSQSLATGDLAAAWRAYSHHLGGHAHLMLYLGDYQRGVRVSRLLLSASLRAHQLEVCESLWHDWIQYLIGLGRLADAEIACDYLTATMPSAKSSRVKELRARVLLLQGRLVAALALVDGVLEAATAADVPPSAEALALRGRLLTLMGRTAEAAEVFETLSRQARWLGIEYLQLLVQVSPPPQDAGVDQVEKDGLLREAAQGAVFEVQQIVEQRRGRESPEFVRCQLLAAELELKDRVAASEEAGRSFEWATVRSAQEVACWARLTQARLDLRRLASAAVREEPLHRSVMAVTEGLNIARNCGYSVFYIDLKVVRSRLFLLGGLAEKAEADAASALREGLPASEDGALLEIVPAADPRCEYRWGESAARHALAEALLLKASQIWGQAPVAHRLPEDLAHDFLAAMQEARAELQTCKGLRKMLQDPLLRETDKVLETLSRGGMTWQTASGQIPTRSAEAPCPATSVPPSQVFVSYNSQDREATRELVNELRARGQRPWFDEDEILPGDPVQRILESAIEVVTAVIVVVGPSGVGPWQEEERWSCFTRMKVRGKRFIRVLLPNAPDDPPSFFENYSYLDLRAGITEEKMSRLLKALQTPLC